MTGSEDFLQAATERAGLIEQLLTIGAALSSTHNLEELLSLILTKSREITYSDAGSVYLVDRSTEELTLLFKVAQNFSAPTVSFQAFSMPLTKKSLAGYVAITGETLNISDAYQLPEEVLYQLDRSFDSSIGYRTCSVLVLPMQNQRGETLGVLQLINRKISRTERITPENALQVTQPFSKWEEQILKSLASQAAISIERNQLQESIEHLFEGFVRASVQIIETRDPCTSGHSERVADLTVRLSKEVSEVATGALAPIQFSHRQIQEIRYAALLHDFGKVGVPEEILNKVKKLYPLQLEVVKYRFALAQRSLEAECAEAKYQYLVDQFSHPHHSAPVSGIGCAHCQTLDSLDSQLNAAIAQLDNYWELLMEANEPRVLIEEPLTRLQELGQYLYRDIDGTQKPLLTSDEMEQLMVRLGNLTEVERLAIQSHVTHTYDFLKQIPWTKDLQNIPLIAYKHHEKLDGSGYPQGLKEGAIPIQSQMIAIADIYDALTAGDRPYKRGLAPATALKILKQQSNSHKLNAELITLFEQRQVFSVLGHNLEAQ